VTSLFQASVRQVLEYQRPDPLMLVLVRDQKRHLGLGRPGAPVVTADSAKLVAVLDDKRQSVDAIDVGEPFDLSSR